MAVQKNMLAVALFTASVSAKSCAAGWGKSETDEFVAKCMAGVAAGIVLGLVFTCLAAVPLCCGRMKPQAKIIAGLSLGLGLLSILCPLFGSLAACAGVVDDVCGKCTGIGGASGCTDAEKTKLMDGCNGLGVLYVYTAAFGFMAIIMGIVSASLACCIFCGCCKMKKDAAFVDGKATSA